MQILHPKDENKTWWRAKYLAKSQVWRKPRDNQNDYYNVLVDGMSNLAQRLVGLLKLIYLQISESLIEK